MTAKVAERATGAGVNSNGLALSPRPFESEMLGLRTANLDLVELSAVAPVGINRALDHARADGVQLVCCRVAERERAAIAALQAGGFAVIECLLTLVCEFAGPVEAPSNVRISRREDADGVGDIGATAFRFDRFHADKRVPDDAADRLKGAWARNSVNGRADAVFVAEAAERITGFNACLLRGDTATIDLIAVADGMQGRGIGRALLYASLAYYAGKAARMTVGTQSANYASLALYQSAGFRIANSAFTLHAHLN